ncbi:MAG: hypothetical protein GY847_25865 [Proteobacteria bacterium]|nr:hypothetical protein [Pseudomonadota bacterium]
MHKSNVNPDWPLGPELKGRLEKIRKAVRRLHRDIEPTKRQPPFFTPHGEIHYEAVERKIKQLIPITSFDEDSGLSASEAFFILGSAWLHDIGMINGVLTGDTDDYTLVRDNHHIRSMEYIKEHYTNVEVLQSEADIFGWLALFHRRRCPLPDCTETSDHDDHGRVRVRLLAAYLRLADALHVDQTRVPAEQWALLLAYDIPLKAKMHWLRSMFVGGIGVDPAGKQITVQFKSRIALPSGDEADSQALARTLSSIYDAITQDLESELDTVKEVLIFGGISSYLKIKRSVTEVVLGERLLNDLRTVLNYYFLLENPSSSALYRLVLQSVRSIVAVHDSGTQTSDKLTGKAVRKFLAEIEESILGTRSCHTGLKTLVKDIRLSVVDRLSRDIAPVDWIERKLKDLEEHRESVRRNACVYFEQQILNDELASDGEITVYNVLLYGFSEITMKSLCGFRDAVIRRLIREEHCEEGSLTPVHRAKFEERASKYFRIFVCEGQPKNRTGWGGTIIYHDGCRYAIALAERGFSQIHVVPDAIAGSLMPPVPRKPSPPTIDFVMVGANGYSNSTFTHSAGHSMIAAVTRDAKANDAAPVLILSLLTDKYSDDGPVDGVTESVDTGSDEEPYITLENWTFRKPFEEEPIRQHVFVSQDPGLRDSLGKIKKAVMFYNQREDIIPMCYVDVVITEKESLRSADFPEEKIGHRISKGPDGSLDDKGVREDT